MVKEIVVKSEQIKDILEGKSKSDKHSTKKRASSNYLKFNKTHSINIAELIEL